MVIAGRYELGEPLGAGGEARVFRAREIATGLEAAVRLTPPTAQEAPPPPRSLPNHPGWVRLLDRGLDPEHGAFTVFELLRGETLGAMASRPPLDADAAQVFAQRSLEAVGALHDAGWVHGDLNADNFLLHDGTTWKLLELPFHRAAAESRPPLFGSIHTLAPEQIDGRRADPRSDLFALGCLYYYAASGRYPHAGGNEAEIAINRLRFPAESWRATDSSLPAAFRTLVMRLLERDPARRPASGSAARQLLRSLEEESRRPVP
jgi:serine/threonine-protein kinase